MSNEEQKRKAEAGAKVVSRLLVVTIIVTVITAILMFLGLTYVVTILVLGMMPAIVAAVVDRRKRKLASKCVICFNATGIMPFMFTIAKAGDPNMLAKDMLVDPYMWLMVYGFASFGWIIVQIIPQLVLLFLIMKADVTVKNLSGLQKKLTDEWGEGVTSKTGASKR